MSKQPSGRPSVPLYTALLSILIIACGTLPDRVDEPGHEIAAGYPTSSDLPLGQARLRRVADDVWVHLSAWQFPDGTTYPMNGLVVRDGDGLILIDTAWGEEATESLLETIRSEIGIPVRSAIITHFHHDRISGTEVLERNGVTVYATPLTRRLALQAGNPVPSDSLAGLTKAGQVVRVGPVEVLYPGAAHTEDNLMVYLPEAALLFGGCAVHEAVREDAGNLEDADLASWPATIQRAQTRYGAAEIVVPGHGVPSGPELLDHTIRVVEGVRN